jgi:hydrogenase maturation protease
VGTAVLDSLHLLSWADKILAIDAMVAGGKPGTVYSFGGPDVEKRGIRTSLHELGLLSALRFLPRQKNPEIQILGIEPETIEYGLELTSAVQKALPLVHPHGQGNCRPLEELTKEMTEALLSPALFQLSSQLSSCENFPSLLH